MSAKNRDNKNRWRNITVGFRVSPEENELITKAVALSDCPVPLHPDSDNGGNSIPALAVPIRRLPC